MKLPAKPSLFVKTGLMGCACSLLAGCSVFTTPPRSDAGAIQAKGKAFAEKSLWVNSRSSELQRKGLAEGDAKAVADIEYRQRTR